MRREAGTSSRFRLCSGPAAARIRLRAILVLAALASSSACAPPAESRDLLELGPDLAEGAASGLRGDLVLASGGKARFHVTLAGASRLRVLGHARGAGRLEARVGLVDPRRGEPVEGPRDTVAGAVAGEPTELDLRVALSPRAGRVVALELAWQARDGEASCRIEALELSEPLPVPRRPIVLVSIDTLAARHLSLYGYPRRTTPELEAFAREAVVFELCRANAPFTTASYLSQFTGLYPRTFHTPPAEDARDRESWEAWSLPDERWTLAELLRSLGYRTAAFVDNPLAGPEFGLGQGFEIYDMEAAGIDPRDPEGGIRHVRPRARAWLEEVLPTGAPFFLFLQALDVHGPYVAPPEFAGSFAGDDLYDRDHELPVIARDHVFGAVPRYLARGAVPPDAELPHTLRTRELVDAYDDCILALDDSFGRIVDDLDELGVLDRAVVIFTADHGETMFQHDLKFGHGRNYEDVLHVPLVVRMPGGARGGTRVSAPVQLLDLYPTVADLLGVERYSWLRGRSLLPLLEGGARRDPTPERPHLAQGGYHASEALVVDGWKLIEDRLAHSHGPTFLTDRRVREWVVERVPELEVFHPGIHPTPWVAALDDPLGFWDELRAAFEDPVWELYDLERDPGETRDLAAEEPLRVERLRARSSELAREIAAERDLVPRAVVPVLDAARIEELRNLGYAGER